MDPTPTIRFAGRTWTVKTSSTPVGPGPNRFSAANVSVVAGRLHLTVERSLIGWTSAEVIAQGEFGYGRYQWTVVTDVTRLDPRTVLGMFTWSDEPDQAHRELDIEFSRWARPGKAKIGSFTVQTLAGAISRSFGAVAGRGEHNLVWAEGKVSFRSRFGSVVREWTHEGADVPSPGGSVAPRINLWLFRGQAPAGPQSVCRRRLKSERFRR